jgi:hypothetical protein
VSRLRPQNDGAAGLSSDHLFNAGDECFVHIACLFSDITSQGVAADDFLYCTLVPNAKGCNVNLLDSANFRGIALSLWQHS